MICSVTCFNVFLKTEIYIHVLSQSESFQKAAAIMLHNSVNH